MQSIKCSHCTSEFYMAFPAPDANCPFCGQPLHSDAYIRRNEKRHKIDKECTISNGFGNLSVQAVDRSDKGIGIKLSSGKAPFAPKDIINIDIAGLVSAAKAQVMWINDSAPQNATYAGMKLCQ